MTPNIEVKMASALQACANAAALVDTGHRDADTMAAVIAAGLAAEDALKAYRAERRATLDRRKRAKEAEEPAQPAPRPPRGWFPALRFDLFIGIPDARRPTRWRNDP